MRADENDSRCRVGEETIINGRIRTKTLQTWSQTTKSMASYDSEKLTSVETKKRGETPWNPPLRQTIIFRCGTGVTYKFLCLFKFSVYLPHLPWPLNTETWSVLRLLIQISKTLMWLLNATPRIGKGWASTERFSDRIGIVLDFSCRDSPIRQWSFSGPFPKFRTAW